MKTTTAAAAIVLLLLATAPIAQADTINLRASVRLTDTGRIVRLGDIASLEGEEARQHAGVVIGEVPADQHTARFTIDDVRAVLDAAGVHWGRINLNGSSVVVRTRRGESGAPMLAMQGASIGSQGRAQVHRTNEEHGDAIACGELINKRTVAGQIARMFVHQLKMPADAIRLSFAGDQAGVLDASIDAMQYEIEPQAGAHSSSVPMHIRGWRDGTVVEQHDITVRPVAMVEAITVTRRIERNEKLASSDLDIRRLWLPPQEAALMAEKTSAVGQTATRPLRPGDVIRTQHIEPAIVIQRGDIVEVRCLVGGVVIAMQAEAREDGAANQMIECRKIGERQTFTARVVGPGEATVDLSRASTTTQQ